MNDCVNADVRPKSSEAAHAPVCAEVSAKRLKTERRVAPPFRITSPTSDLAWMLYGALGAIAALSALVGL